MSHANPTSEAGAGAEALLGLAAQAGQAVRLPSLPSIAKQTPSHSPFLPAPPSLSPQQTLQPTQHPTTPLQPSPPLPPPPSLSRERLPTLSEWADPAFRPFPPPVLAPLPDRWQTSAPVPPPPPTQYPYHNPWQSYPYPPPYYYYQQQNMSYPIPPQPSVAPVPPPLALPGRPVIPPLRVPMHSDPVRDAAATNDVSVFPPIPQPPTTSNRDPLLERLTSEATAAPKKTPSRARGLADLMNPTDTVPASTSGIPQSRMDLPLIKPESIETKVTPVTVPTVPSAEPKLTDIVKDRPHTGKFDLAAIADVPTDTLRKDSPHKSETIRAEEKPREQPEDDKGTKHITQVEDAALSDRRQPHGEKEKKIDEANALPERPSDEGVNQEKPTALALPQEDEEMPERKEESDSDLDMVEDEDEDEDDGKEKEDGESGDEVTRCPCGSQINSGTMIACDQCNTWQHSRCMGFRRSSEMPEKYYCHICRPDEIRLTCVAHPKFKELSNKEKNSLYRRDYESQFAIVKPVELRKLFVSDMRHKKALMRSKGDVFLRYAGHVRNQHGKHRASIVDGLMILLDMQHQDVVERLDAAMKRLKTEKQDDVERKRSTTTSNEGPLNEIGNGRTPSNSRGHAQKRARPYSLSMDGSEAASGVRGESSEALTDFDLGTDTMHARNMSREERKLQQTMKLFARMEEREREKKKPRTGDVSASPRTGPPSRSRTPKPSGTRTVSPKTPTTAMDTEEPTRKVASESQQSTETDSPEQRQRLTSEARSADSPRQNQRQEDASHPKLVQPVPQQKSSLTSRSENDISKKDREQRKERPERPAPRRKESCSPDNSNGNANGRRRSILARERSQSQDTKRRRAGHSKESERRNGTSKEPPEKRDPTLEFSVVVPGPSVIGSKKITKVRLSTLDREIREKEEAETRHENNQGLSNGNKKEWLLEDARQEAMKKFLNGGKSPCPMKKRYRLGDELREEESDVEAEEQKESDQPLVDPPVSGKASETLSVSMVVVSEKGSLPDRGQILESTRLILPGANGKSGDAMADRAGSAKPVCLKKRPTMLTPNTELNGSEDPGESLKPNKTETPLKQSTPSKLSSPSSPSPEKSPSSPLQRVASPKLRSCPPPVLRSPTLRSVPANDAKQLLRSPSPLPSFRSQKLSPSVQKRRSHSPKADEKQREAVPHLSRKILSGLSPTYNADDKPRRSSPDSSTAVGRSEEKPKGSEELTPNVTESQTNPDSKSPQNSSAPPPLRSIRSVPPPVPKKVETSTEKMQTAGREGYIDGTSDPGQPSLGKHSSGGATISDIFQQRLQDFLRPSGASPAPSPRGSGPKYGLSSPQPSPRAGTSHLNVESPTPNVRGSAAKLGAAQPLSARPNLDGLRNSNGLSPRVSGSGHVYSRNYGPNFRSKPPDLDRPWNPVPSFSSLKRQHSFGRGSRGNSFIGGKPGSFSGIDRGRHGYGRDGMSSYGRDDMMDKARSGYRRDGHFPVNRDDDKLQNGNPHSWGRPYGQRNGWGRGGPGHHSSGDGSDRGSRRGHHGS